MNDRRNPNPGSPQPLPPATPRFTGWKLWRLRLLALVAVPCAVLAFVEVTLRVAGFGYPTSFLLPSENHGHATFVQNNRFGWRFFGKRMSRVPRPFSILQNKPPDTIRVFVFGESAAFGDPQPAFGLPRVLQATLSLRHPQMKFEVVNAAMTAINSHVIVPLASDCSRGGGDIWVVYIGNNEVVGPFGAGTIFGSQAPPLALVRATLALKTTRIGQLIDAAREQWLKPPADRSDWDGLTMFLGQSVRADDPRMATVHRNFERNLADIIRAGHDSGAGIVVSTVAVNLKDCAPFATGNRAGMSGQDKRKCDDLTRLGSQAQAAGKFSEALGQFQAAAQLDDSSAEIQFRLGRCQLALGDFPDGQRALSAARDLDPLRFRCDSRLNDLTRKAASGRESERILLADAERSFAAASPDGVPGGDLFYEHVHLTFEGNCLLARTLAEQIEKLLPRDPSAANPAWPPVAECAGRLGRTDRDLQSALVYILARLMKPPFTTQINHDEQVQRITTQARELAKMNGAATVAQAVEAAQAAIAASPEDAQLYEQLAVLELNAGRHAEAEAAARRMVDLLPCSASGWSQLGFTFVQEQKFDEAVKAYQRAFDLNPQDVEPLKNLATALVKSGRTNEALREFRRAVALSPRFGTAWVGLGQALEGMGRKDEAAECFQKGLQNPVYSAPELAALARFCKSRGWLQAAFTNYSDAIKLDPSDPTLPFEAGETLAALGRHREAAERYQEAARVSPAWGQAHFFYAMELGACGQIAGAAREFQEAARLMPDMLEARLNWGLALAKEGQFEQARSELEEVAARSPTNAVARHYLDLLRQQNQKGESPPP
jgi:tetratricopeptide (TPR) repeat protein